jgi:hypothetical protein
MVGVMHTVWMDVDYEYATITITPASMTRRARFARKRAAELAEIEQDGWEVVSTEPERIFRRGDKITVKRPKRTGLEPAVSPPAAGGMLGWWDSLDTNRRIGYGMIAIAVVVSLLALGF